MMKSVYIGLAHPTTTEPPTTHAGQMQTTQERPTKTSVYIRTRTLVTKLTFFYPYTNKIQKQVKFQLLNPNLKPGSRHKMLFAPVPLKQLKITQSWTPEQTKVQCPKLNSGKFEPHTQQQA